MDDNDLELNLLGGSPIELSKLGKLHPLTLREIKEIGEIKYNKLISVLISYQEGMEFEGHKLNGFETTLLYCFHDGNFNELVMNAFYRFFKEETHLHNDGFFYLGDIEENRYITEEIYNEIVAIIKKQNFINDKQEKEEEFVPHDEYAAGLIEKLKHFRQKVKEKNQEDGLNLSDIISIVAAHSCNLNIFTVWDLTVYQLYTIYIRLIMKDNYDSNYSLLPPVSDSKSLDLKHWATKINK